MRGDGGTGASGSPGIREAIEQEARGDISTLSSERKEGGGCGKDEAQEREREVEQQRAHLFALVAKDSASGLFARCLRHADERGRALERAGVCWGAQRDIRPVWRGNGGRGEGERKEGRKTRRRGCSSLSSSSLSLPFSLSFRHVRSSSRQGHALHWVEAAGERRRGHSDTLPIKAKQPKEGVTLVKDPEAAAQRQDVVSEEVPSMKRGAGAEERRGREAARGGGLKRKRKARVCTGVNMS